MPFDGIVTKCIYRELSEIIVGGRVDKIYQPEPDEIVLNLRAKSRNLKLLLSASASYPRVHLTENSRDNPAAAPVFCMLLRKHLSGGRIAGVCFHDYERIITIIIESANELGDISQKKLITEIMGRHSNIILLNESDKIIDSIKHVDNEVSSVREVMPARQYMLPPSQKKTSPASLDTGVLLGSYAEGSFISAEKFLLENIKGFSPLLCREVCHRAGIDAALPLPHSDNDCMHSLKNILDEIIADITSDNYAPCLIYGSSNKPGKISNSSNSNSSSSNSNSSSSNSSNSNSSSNNSSNNNNRSEKPIDYHCLEITQYSNIKHMDSISKVLDDYYTARDNEERLKQKKSGVIRLLNTCIDRCNKKAALQQEKLREVSDREKLKLYGELITANIYRIPANIRSVEVQNYYSENNEIIAIPLDENQSPQKNAQSYFKQYTRAKSAFYNTNRQLDDTMKEMEYLESVIVLLENCTQANEIDEIRQELANEGYISQRVKSVAKIRERVSLPLHYRSSDGYDIYVGRNNIQNERLTHKSSSPKDLWLHTRNIPGSHVIIKSSGTIIPDRTLSEAAILAALHSKARMSSNVPVDYTLVKNIKKPPGSRPGKVIYDNYRTIIVNPGENNLTTLDINV